MSKHTNNLRRMANEAHDCGDWAAAERLRQAADQIDRITRERDAACDDVGELTEALLAIAARLGVEPVNLANGADCLEAIDRLTRERDEARAVLADLGGDHEALEPYAPPGWWFCSAPFKHCWIGPNGQQVFAAIGGEKRGALAAMRAADEALRVSEEGER